METPFSLCRFPRAIVHLDADAFFASVEQAVVPALRGRPVVTGKERGIIACASYEAKARGVGRGMTLAEARARCPGLIVVPSDYETYSLYSRRMFHIVRRYTPLVEEYSVDEAFADITGLRRVFRASYPQIAGQIQRDIREQLGITVSVGLSLSKSLAKLCSEFRKPAGFTAVEGRYVHILLQKTPLDRVWGFGPNTVALLEKLGLRRAYDFAVRPEQWAERLLGKVGRDLWHELRGRAAYTVAAEAPAPQATIMKCKTFAPPSGDSGLVYGALVKNVESAMMKARRHGLRPRLLGIILRRQSFAEDALEAALSRPTSSAVEVMPLVRSLFGRLFREGVTYRATGATLGRLEDDRLRQSDLFEDEVRIEALQRVSRAVDAINGRYGKHTVRSGASLCLLRKGHSSRDDIPKRRQHQLPGENGRQRLNIPRMTLSV